MSFLYKKIILVVIQVLQIQSSSYAYLYNSSINYIRIDEFIKYLGTTIYLYTIIINNKMYIYLIHYTYVIVTETETIVTLLLR